ncbi:S1-like domain-containing RNA-binding protein [Galbibacter sp. EGI 63066]|uniref:CvfB family protein n=1 Tax=Galbibacter sp. EGI 63066 TaxID=2993559 RepID=UPI0022487FB3|nr:S1-like domain-containing RNA-binding protein [Galbibacter sp. EGI 63066]MCX2680120.1 S1-like domain-containing RNA-binding protein [Galbibacter sp. EGI 63066]
MIQIGEYNTLEILRETSVGLFLGDEEGNDILLPNKYVPNDYEIGDTITVFCYLDHEERPVSTTLTPKITKNSFALLHVAETSGIGAFLDWGLEKQLFVPFKEQARKMEAGKWYLVYAFLDEKTNRMVGSSKTNQFLSNEELTITPDEEVDLIISRFTDIGVEVIINEKHKGLVYNNEIFHDLKLGGRQKGYVKKIREGNKVDISLQPIGYKNLEPVSQKVMDALKRNNGFLGLHDKSDPEDIKAILGMSKKSFKKAIGILYKNRQLLIKDDGIHLIS